MSNKKYQANNLNNEKATRVSSIEEMVAILDGKAIKITENGVSKFFYLKENEKIETAHRIAEMYLQHFPRPNTYGAHLSSSESGYGLTIFHQLTEEEIATIRSWKENSIDEDGEEISLEDYLAWKNEELLEKLIRNDSLYELDTLDSCDLESPLKFTKFSIQFKDDDGNLGYSFPFPCPLTDEEFVELLTFCLIEKNRISMNMLMYRKPEITQHVIEHLVWSYYDFRFESYKPSICELDELKSIAQSILDPSVDTLHLIDSEDIRIKAFLKEHKIEKGSQK